MGEPARALEVAEYLRLDEESEGRHEYLNGVVVAMAGASPRHNVIVTNVAALLRDRLRETPCVVLGSDQRVRIELTRSYVYPDVSVACGDARFTDERPASLENPRLVIEVLSPSTEEHDRGVKLAHYRRLASIAEIVLIETNARRAEVYRRLDDGRWLITDIEAGVIELASLSCELPLDEVYAKVSALPEDPPR
jgi:Uma2 family endonuclease